MTEIELLLSVFVDVTPDKNVNYSSDDTTQAVYKKCDTKPLRAPSISSPRELVSYPIRIQRCISINLFLEHKSDTSHSSPQRLISGRCQCAT